ncbi:hypothetical protein D030_1024A, partial [Vibrio parahaemolyticus AQ3810]
MAFLG